MNWLMYVILGFFLFLAWGVAQGLSDCETNPPQTLSCSSNNLIDNGFEDCKKIKSEVTGFLFFQNAEDSIYSCFHNGERLDVEFKQTKCSYSTSNLTSDWSHCKK